MFLVIETCQLPPWEEKSDKLFCILRDSMNPSSSTKPICILKDDQDREWLQAQIKDSTLLPLRLRRGPLVLLTPHHGVSQPSAQPLPERLQAPLVQSECSKAPEPTTSLRKDAELRLSPRVVCWPRTSCVWSKRFMPLLLFCNYILLIKYYINW